VRPEPFPGLVDLVIRSFRSGVRLLRRAFRDPHHPAVLARLEWMCGCEPQQPAGTCKTEWN
jgi:hypothetical protein